MPLCGPDTSALGNYVIIADVGHLPTGAARYNGVRVFQADTGQTKMWDGIGWVIMDEPAQTWTPTFASGVTVGNGAWSLSTYHRSDGYVDLAGVFTLGSTSAVTGPIAVNLPIAALGLQAGDVWAELGDASAASYGPGIPNLGATTNFTLAALAAGGSYGTYAATSAVVPFAWAVGDLIKVGGHYRMSTRYL